MLTQVFGFGMEPGVTMSQEVGSCFGTWLCEDSGVELLFSACQAISHTMTLSHSMTL